MTASPTGGTGPSDTRPAGGEAGGRVASGQQRVARVRHQQAPRPTQAELVQRLLVVEQMLVQRVPISKIRQAAKSDPQLGWYVSRKTLDRYVLTIRREWARQRVGVGKPEVIEGYRRSLEETFARAYEARQYSASIAALRTLAELDGALGRLQVNVDASTTNQHLHVGGGEGVALADLVEHLDGLPADEVAVLRRLAQRALAPHDDAGE